MEDNKYYEKLKIIFNKRTFGLDDIEKESDRIDLVKLAMDECFHLALIKELRGLRKDFREANKLI